MNSYESLSLSFYIYVCVCAMAIFTEIKWYKINLVPQGE